MRRRILVVAVTAAIVAMVLFALPSAYAAHRLFQSEEQSELERAALRALVRVDPDFVGGATVTLPRTSGDITVALYDVHGRRVAGNGPAVGRGPVATALRTNQPVQGGYADRMVDALPVSSGNTVVGVVAASSATSEVWRRTLTVWAAMFGVALVALGLAVLLARRQAARLNRPLERLAASAKSLGEGDFSTRNAPSGVEEIDETGAALNASAARLGDLVARERQLAANASHQLRTPLTGLRLTLETALDGDEATLRTAAVEAIATADHLETTVEELLRLARGTANATGEAVPRDLLDEAAHRWGPSLTAAGRPLVVVVDEHAPAVRCSPSATAQVLDILLDNALRHGSGTVTLGARASMGALAIDVQDEGTERLRDEVFERGWSASDGAGIGLALGRDLATSQGGRLLLSAGRPGTVFTLLLPAAVGADEEDAPEAAAVVRP